MGGGLYWMYTPMRSLELKGRNNMPNLLKRFGHAIVPTSLRPQVRRVLSKRRVVRKALYGGNLRYCPICQSHLHAFEPQGPTQRPNARCPICGSMERHRFFFLFANQEMGLCAAPKKKMLHVAPEACLVPILSECEHLDYLTADLMPGAMVQMDLTDIHMPDETFDVVVASHVLEHIPDDRKAMREVFRVLKPGGWAVMQVPVTTTETFEDLSIVDPHERIRVYGHHEHVRRCGEDYYSRMSEVGFELCMSKLPVQEDQAECTRLGITPYQSIPLCVKR